MPRKRKHQRKTEIVQHLDVNFEGIKVFQAKNLPLFDKDNFPLYEYVIPKRKLHDELHALEIDWQPNWKNIMVISDLHFGDGSPYDNFVGEFLEFKAWIDKYAPDVVVLNGDIFDLWKSKMNDCMTAHNEFIDYFITSEHPRFFYLRGNHDCFEEAFDFLIINSQQNKRILIGHGFQNDPFLYKKLPKAAVWLSKYTEYFKRNAENYFDNLYQKWELFKHQIQDPTFKETTICYLTRVFSENAIDKGNFDVVIHGHTHDTPYVKKHHKGLIINDGCCQKDARQATIYTDHDTFTLINDRDIDPLY